MPIHTSEQGWILETQSTGYAFGLNAAGLLTHRHRGARLPRAEDYPTAPDPMPWVLFNGTAYLRPEQFPEYAETNPSHLNLFVKGNTIFPN